MACCCDTYKEFGCFSDCSVSIVTGIAAPAAGDYVMEIKYLGTVEKKTTTFALAAPVTFSITDINRDYAYEFQIRKPDGTYLELDEGVSCGRFTTVPAIVI